MLIAKADENVEFMNGLIAFVVFVKNWFLVVESCHFLQMSHFVIFVGQTAVRIRIQLTDVVGLPLYF